MEDIPGGAKTINRVVLFLTKLIFFKPRRRHGFQVHRVYINHRGIFKAFWISCRAGMDVMLTVEAKVISEMMASVPSAPLRDRS